ncbi:MAG TPA: hypothetical protein VEB86_00915 [Chryseosolibacter sp.]|nr:hypothetical protein [Chryseosolibacter sp.]
MSILKYVERFKRMDELIRRRATGSSEQFANKLNISRSVLMEDLSEMRELGANIKYCIYSQSYYYENDFELIIGPRKERMVIGGAGVDVLNEILYYNDLQDPEQTQG